MVLCFVLVQSISCLRLTKHDAKVFYETDHLDRSSLVSMEEVIASPSTWFIPTIGGKSLVTTEIGGARALLVSGKSLGSLDMLQDPAQVSTMIYLGSRKSHYVALEVVEGSALASSLLLRDRVKAVLLRRVSDRLSFDLHAEGESLGSDAPSLLALAVAYTSWHSRARFCQVCGFPTRSTPTGTGRKCSSPSCNKSHYPRIEPAVIMLILSRCRRYALLGRKKSWIPNRYSCLAGFVETGETLEQTVVRETKEEAGIDVELGSLNYFASQPWPFPSSLMLGFSGVVAAEESSPPAPPPFDRDEMDDVAWFSIEKVREALPMFIDEADALALSKAGSPLPELHFPGPSSLARAMLSSWAGAADE